VRGEAVDGKVVVGVCVTGVEVNGDFVVGDVVVGVRLKGLVVGDFVVGDVVVGVRLKGLVVGAGVGMCWQAHNRWISPPTVAAQLYWLSSRPLATAYEHFPFDSL
jgi:hypothetical protein